MPIRERRGMENVYSRLCAIHCLVQLCVPELLVNERASSKILPLNCTSESDGVCTKMTED